MTTLKYFEGSLVGKKYKCGLEFVFRIAVPCVDVEKFALLVEHDGQNDVNVNSMVRLADEGKAPYCISVGVFAGELQTHDNTLRNMRMNSYDLFDREYGDFLVYELLPYVAETYNLHFYESPDMHFISGGSSGGISAFVVAWFHSEYFHRVYMSSPSFLAMGRGNEIPYLIRKYETKPIRVYEEYSENEPNDYFGWSRTIDAETCEALTFANYDFKCAFFAGEGHCSRYRNEEEAYKRNEWIWKNWETEPIVAPTNSPRVDKVIPCGSCWVRCEAMPQTKVITPPAEFTDAFNNVVHSNDGQVWYVANESDDIVYMYVNAEEIDLDKRLLHATLHTIPRFAVKGAIDMVVDQTDRLYVLTEIGIQCVRSYGLIDVILELPDKTKPKKIAITDALYISTEEGVYRRALCEECITSSDSKRKYVSYYD